MSRAWRSCSPDSPSACPASRSIACAARVSTPGWRFVNPKFKAQYGVDSMAETAEHVAEAYGISRQDQDRFAWQSQRRAAEGLAAGRFADEIVPVAISPPKGQASILTADE